MIIQIHCFNGEYSIWLESDCPAFKEDKLISIIKKVKEDNKYVGFEQEFIDALKKEGINAQKLKPHIEVN